MQSIAALKSKRQCINKITLYLRDISNSAPTRQHKEEMGKFRCAVTFFKIETGCTKRHFAEKQETKTEKLRGQWKLKERTGETVNLI